MTNSNATQRWSFDGISLADRLPIQLGLGIPVILVRADNGLDEFWYDEAYDAGAYVKATPDTLETVLSELLSNPREIDNLAERGRRFVKTRLTRSRLICYLHQLITQYAERQR